jgi:hypothetical protein
MRVVLIPQHNGFHLFKGHKRNADFPIHLDLPDVPVGQNTAGLFAQPQYLHDRFKRIIVRVSRLRCVIVPYRWPLGGVAVETNIGWRQSADQR